MIIKNADIFTPDHRFVQGDVAITGDRFSTVLEETDGDGPVSYTHLTLPTKPWV